VILIDARDDANPFRFQVEAQASPDVLDVREEDVTPEVTASLSLRLDQWVQRQPGISLPQGTGTVTLTSPFQIPSSGTTRITIEYLLVATPGETSEFVAATKVVSYPVGR
jgi:hypothetical protein